MNSYDLSRAFWNWAFDNPEKISPNHAAIYFFSVEHCNRLGWKTKFGLPSQMVMDAIGIKKHSTYIRYFNDLVEFKFFSLIQKSKNQYSSNIISLTSALPKKGEALDKAISKHVAKQTESNGQSKRSIDKPLNKEPLNNKKDIEIGLFLDWFNEVVKIKTGNKGKFRTLTDTDYNNLVKVKKVYSTDDFNCAVDNLYLSDWAKDNNMRTPSHFLRVENFNKYLNQESNSYIHIDNSPVN